MACTHLDYKGSRAFAYGEECECGFLYRGAGSWLSPEAWERMTARRREANKRRYHKNLEESREYGRRHQRELREKDPIRYRLIATRARAKKTGVEFALTPGDIKIPARCPVLGLPLVKVGAVDDPLSWEIDRVDPRGGYVPGNIRVISRRANKLKSDGSLREFEQLVAYMRNEK